MNDTINETVRFSVKPNPLLYALEFTLYILLVAAAVELSIGIPLGWPGVHSRASVLLLITFVLLGLSLFIVAVATACHLVFVVTDKRAIVRFSFWGMTTDGLSIAIESVKHIEVISYGATYGSVYLKCDERSARENSNGSEPDDPQPVLRASIPIKRTDSIGPTLNIWRRFLGFYGFKGFDEFANIISEQQNSVPNVKGEHDA
jgi:hypothetical protein